MRHLTNLQRRALELLSPRGTVCRHSNEIWETYYRINGSTSGAVIRSRTLWSLVDAGLLAHEYDGRHDIFRISEAGRAVLEPLITSQQGNDDA